MSLILRKFGEMDALLHFCTGGLAPGGVGVCFSCCSGTMCGKVAD